MSNRPINKKKVITSLVWKLLERGGSQGVQFIIQIVLARLLLPEDFGLIAIVSILIIFAEVFISSGLNTSLIQKGKIDEIDTSSVFYINILIATLLYLIMFYSSPYIAFFFEMPELRNVIRVLGIVVFFDALYSVQYSIISRNMEFKKLFIATFGSVIISGIVSIYLAYNNFGVWSLIYQQLISRVLTSISIIFTVKWYPKFLFSFKRIKSLFSFGWKVLISTLIDTLFDNLRSLMIGKYYTPASLGYYNRGKQFPSVIVNNINGSIQAVLLPTLSAEQENIGRVKTMTRRAIITSAYLIFPLMFGLIVIAEPLVIILLTNKWLQSVFFLQIYCLTFSLRPVQTANLQAIIAIGRSDILLRLQTIKNIIGLIILFISIPLGINAIAIGTFLSTVISTVVNIYPNLRLLKYSYKEQLADILPSLLLSITMGVLIYSLRLMISSTYILLMSQIILGVIYYLFASRIMKIDAYQYLVRARKSFFS